MDYQDEIILCRECGQPFLWSAQEQNLYATRAFERPHRCIDCRDEARARRELQGALQRHPFAGRPR